MHYLHAILVEVEEGEDKDDVLRRALDAIEDYSDVAWDWHAGGPGRWADEYPAVLLGRENRQEFLRQFEDWREAPLEAALDHAAWARGSDWAWRTQEEIDEGGYQVFPNEASGERHRGGEPLFWSAKPEKEQWSVEDLVRRLWDPGESSGLWAYNVQKAVELACGEYRCDSQFYSVPDGSARISPGTLEAVRQNPERYALVFVDVHY